MRLHADAAEASLIKRLFLTLFALLVGVVGAVAACRAVFNTYVFSVFVSLAFLLYLGALLLLLWWFCYQLQSVLEASAQQLSERRGCALSISPSD